MVCCRICLICIISLAVFLPDALFNEVFAVSAKERSLFQRSIIGYRKHLNPKYKKNVRKETKYIIVHTSEGGLQSTLKTVSGGKLTHNGNRTFGGHAHYVIARDGRTFRILDKKYIADHAGRSMWNGETNLSRVSIGIEIVGYHYDSITGQQYRSVNNLIKILQRIYNLNDRAVLTHSQVAYGKPNRWFQSDHRGRKRCAKNFDRRKAGLGPTGSYDPDVRAGRLTADKALAAIFYDSSAAAADVSEQNNVISKTNTAWAIAGEDYNSPQTLYKIPDGRIIAGDQIEKKIGWNRIAPNTVVLLNQQHLPEILAQTSPVKILSNGATAWSFAGREYNSRSTFYFLPSGTIADGTQISDWDDLPSQTRLIIGYKGPYAVNDSITAYRIAGHKYQDKHTIYYLPNHKVYTGNNVPDFSRLPTGTMVFLPAL